MPRWRPIAGRALLAFTSLALSLAAAEGVYRWRMDASGAPDGGDDGWYQRYRHMNETLYRASPDPELIYEPVPGSAVEMEYGLASFNGARLRAEGETAIDPDPARVRVAMVGDSLVWSEYLALSDSLPRRTEEALGEGFEVLNAGVTGYDTTQEARWYEVAVRPLSPRVVLVVYCMNDMMIMSGPFERFATGRSRADKDAQDAFFAEIAPVRRETIDDVIQRRERDATSRLLARGLGIYERWRFEGAYRDEYLIVAEDAARRARVTAALARLGAAIRGDGAIPLLVISPVLERWDDYRWSDVHGFVREAAEHAGFAVLDPLATFQSAYDAETMRMGTDNLHYGRTGARAFGETVAPFIREALE